MLTAQPKSQDATFNFLLSFHVLSVESCQFALLNSFSWPFFSISAASVSLNAVASIEGILAKEGCDNFGI